MEEEKDLYQEMDKKIDRRFTSTCAQLWLVGSMVTQNLVASFIMLTFAVLWYLYSRKFK